MKLFKFGVERVWYEPRQPLMDTRKRAKCIVLKILSNYYFLNKRRINTFAAQLFYQ